MISDFKSGEKILNDFVLRNKELRAKKDSNVKYLSVELGDSSGRLFGSLWDNVDKTNSSIAIGEIVHVKGTVIDWKGRQHLSIDSIKPVSKEDGVDSDEFVPKAKEKPDELFKKFLSWKEHIEDKHLRDLVDLIFNDKAVKSCFKESPAGKLWHHNYKGGLMDHSTQVAAICKGMAESYSEINKDLLITAAMLHDIGKMREFKCDGFIDYSDEGRLLGHVVIGYGIVKSFIDKVDNFPEGLKFELLHLILSHQGKRDNGSPVDPMTREALILYYADEIDSKLNAFGRIYKQEYEPGKKWSNYVRLMNRFFYFGDGKPAEKATR